MNINKLDESFIRQANNIALESAKNGFDPFGAILVKEGKSVSTSADRCIQYSDPTAHAELILISEFCKRNQLISLEGYTIYCNVEPCVMCSGAIHWSRISKVVYGVSQASLQSVSKGRLKPSCEDLINIGNKKIQIIGPVIPEEGIRILNKVRFQSKKERHKAYHEQKKNSR